MISLDGVMQAPGGPGEDPEGGFEFGGWVAPYGDEGYVKVVEKELELHDYLLGRKTFKIWENYWPEHDEFWPAVNVGTKYVFSNTVKETGWQHSVFLNSIDELKKLKNSKGMDLQVWGSSELVQLLLQHDLVDEIRLKIHPLILGKGKKLFSNNAVPAAYTLIDHIVTSNGVIIANYERAGDVQTGTVGEP